MAIPHIESAESRLRASQEAQRAGDFDAMLEHAAQASEVDASDLRVRFRLLECLLYCGRADRVLAELAALEAAAGDDHRLLCQIAEYFTHCARHESALRCCRMAAQLQPQNPQYRFALSAAEIAIGDLDAAEWHLDKVIAINPHDYDAYRNRATLKRQSKHDNHIVEIEAMLDLGAKTPAGEVQLCYALAKEYEDLGQKHKSFSYLSRGADKRRSIMNYQVEGDIAVMTRLGFVFDESAVQRNSPACEETGPIFIMGLPRSGTTLVDRILSSHSRVDSLGEINNFAYSLMHTIGQSGDKLQLVEASANIDFGELGRRYVDSVKNFGRAGPHLIDKTPLNYLYIGLIRLALPNAPIVHIRRNPMDSCFGMYRTLFRAGYPFSYDFEDLGKYYAAYRRLMEHWDRVLPGAILDVEYESLVDDQEQVSREIVEYCGLEWEPACLNFHANASAVSTASSAQVRQPMYRDALQRWRRYERQLQPLAESLQREGIDVFAT